MGTFKTTNLTGMFDELSGQLSKLHVFEMDEELEQVKSTYSTMLHYMVKGVEDPNSRKIYMDLKRRCHVMAHRSRRLSRLSTNNDDKYVKIYNSSKSFSLQNQASMLESQCKRLDELESSSDISESIKEHDFKESIDKRSVRDTALYESEILMSQGG